MPEYISGRQRNLNLGISSYSENRDTLNVIGNILLSSGGVGVGTTLPSQDVDVNTLRIRDTVYDYNNFGGEFGYYLVKDAEGIKWVAVSPINTNAIFVAENNNILGVSSFVGINIISDELIGVSTNPINSSFADITIVSRWSKSSDSGIYTTKNVGIGTTIPIADFQVGFGSTGVTIDGSSGIVSAISYYGENGFLKTLDVTDFLTSGISTVLNELNIIGLGSTSVSVYLASAGGITTTGGDLFVGGVLYGNTIQFTEINTENINITGIASIKNAEIDTLKVLGVSTFVNGPVLIGIGTSTGTDNQVLQIIGNEYISGNLGVGTTNPTQTVDIRGGLRVSGQIFDRFNNAGTQGAVLTSDPLTNSWYWAEPPPILIGILSALDDVTYYPALRLTSDDGRNGIGSAAYLQIDNDLQNGFSYKINPARLGIGTTNPQFTLDVFGTSKFNGNINVTGITSTKNLIVDEQITTNNLVAQRSNISNLVSAASTISLLDVDTIDVDFIVGIAVTFDRINVDDIYANSGDFDNIISVGSSLKSLNSDNVIVGVAITAEFLDANRSEIDNIISTASTITKLNSLNGEITNLVSTSSTITNLGVSSANIDYLDTNFGVFDNINSSNIVGTIITSVTSNSDNLISIAASFKELNVSGISTFDNGPVLIGIGTSTGTTDQKLQVSGNSYISGNVGVGTTNPTQTVDIRGGLRVSGQIFDRFNNAGTQGAVLTSDPLTNSWYWAEPQPLLIGILTALDDVTYYPALRLTSDDGRNGIGSASYLQIDNESNSGFSYKINPARLGIGTTNPQFTLDVFGSGRFNGSVSISSFISGFGATFINLRAISSLIDYTTGIGASYSGIVTTNTLNTNNIISNRLRVTGISTFDNGPVLIGIGTSTGTTDQKLQVSGNSYISGNVGVGTTNPQYKLDVNGDSRINGDLYVNDIITTGADAEQIILSSSGKINTNSLAPVVIDSFNITEYRSAKYVVQGTTKNSLGIGSTVSVKNLNGGLNYFPGTYNNVSLSSSTGSGVNVSATITVSPQFNLGITTCSSGIFSFTGSAVGMITGQTLTFNQTLNILPLEQSKLTGIQLNSSGFGYTTIPSITVQAPIISDNPVPGVGVGSTAIIVISSMNVQNFNISSGISTTIIPSVTFSSPSFGVTATGIVGFGISIVNVNNVGIGYTVSPVLTLSKVTGFAASVGLGISTLNWQTTSGSNYTSPTISIQGVNGIGTGAVIEADVDVNSPNGLINFRITNSGIGYTRPPIVTISDTTGVGAAVTITSMNVSNVVVNNIGSGSTTGIQTSDFTLSPIGGIGTGAVFSAPQIVPTNVIVTNVGSGYTIGNIPVTATFSNPSIGATVSLGVGSISITSPGIGYTVLPTLTISSPNLGIGSTALASSIKLGYDEIALFNGPGFGNTTAVYYVQPLGSNSFGISTTSGGPRITLGYGVNPSTTRVSVGGTVTQVQITSGGSGYQIDDILIASGFDSSRIDTNIGVGFSFRVRDTVNIFQISDLLLLQTASGGNPNAFVIETAGISDTSDLGEFSADVSGNLARLLFTPVYANNEIKFFKTLFRI